MTSTTGCFGQKLSKGNKISTETLCIWTFGKAKLYCKQILFLTFSNKVPCIHQIKSSKHNPNFRIEVTFYDHRTNFLCLFQPQNKFPLMFIFWLKHKVLPKFSAAEYDTHFRATLRGKPAGSIEHTVVYPPNGVIPFHGFAMFCAPFCYVYDDTIQLYLCKYMAATFFIVNFFWVSSSACPQTRIKTEIYVLTYELVLRV